MSWMVPRQLGSALGMFLMLNCSVRLYDTMQDTAGPKHLWEFYVDFWMQHFRNPLPAASGENRLTYSGTNFLLEGC
jgi:hypothetical protein